MKVKLYYYNPYITFNGEKTTIPFNLILDQIYILDEQNKFKETRLGEYSLLRMRYPDLNRDINDRSVCFADYRARKPKLGEKGGNRFEDIIDDVFESTNCFYQHTENLLIMEYNHYGAKAKHIEAYLACFLPSDEDNFWGVELVEIEPSVPLEDVLNSDDIRFLDIKLDMTSNQRRVIQEAQVEESSSVIQNIKEEPLSIIENIADLQEHLGGNVAQIYLGNGRKKDKILDSDAVKNLIRVIDLESDLYISIKVKYFSRQLSRMNEIDLKNASVLKEEIDLDGDAWETIADSIEEFFYDYGRKGSGHHQRFRDALIAHEMPNLVE